MLTELHLENFKPWRDLQLELGKITALFGENSAGKSSLIQFLLMLKQTKNAADRGLVLDFGGGPTELVDLGNYGATVHRGVATEADLPDMQWALTWRLGARRRLSVRLDPVERSNGALGDDKVKLTARVGQQAAPELRLVAKHLEYEFGNTTFELKQKEGSGGFELASSNAELLKARGRRRGFLGRQIAKSQRNEVLPGPVKTHLFPSEARLEAPHLYFAVSRFETWYEDLIDRIFYLGPVRDSPRREYRWSGAGREGVGHSGEYTIDAILAATERQPGENLQGKIAGHLKDLGLIESFSLREFAKGTGLYEAVVRRDGNGPETTLVDVGFGVSQVLPVLVLLYYVPPHSIVLMEQPELHLHPSVQSGLADVMLEVARKRHLQIVIESHSEHLLRRLQRRVAEGQMAASDLKLYFVRSGEGEAMLDRLRLNEWGGIENWPDKFFGDEMGEIAATSKAGLERRMKADRRE